MDEGSGEKSEGNEEQGETVEMTTTPCAPSIKAKASRRKGVLVYTRERRGHARGYIVLLGFFFGVAAAGKTGTVLSPRNTRSFLLRGRGARAK